MSVAATLPRMTEHQFENGYSLEIENFQVPPPTSVTLDPSVDAEIRNDGSFKTLEFRQFALVETIENSHRQRTLNI